MSPSAGFRARFELLEKIGSGVSSEVYRARQVGLDRPVVVKLFRARGPEAGELRQRFLVEARLLAGLDHPRVVGLIDHGVEGETAYMVYPDERGVSLEAWRARERPLEPLLAATILAQILEGLAALHGAGVVHRDLKPSNVLVVDGPEVRIIDLGIARDLDASGALTSTGEFLGTPIYASPGQVLGEGADPRNDLYAAGVIGYELVTGVNPFRADSVGEVLEKQLRLVPPAPDAVRPGVPRALALFVMQLLEKRPADRPAGAAEALERLRERVLGASGSGAPMRPAPPPQAGAGTLVAARPAGAAAPEPVSPGGPVAGGPGVGTRPWILVLALGAALGAGLWARGRITGGRGIPPVANEAPASREAVGPRDPGYAEAVREELERAAGWMLGKDLRVGPVPESGMPAGARRLLDPDPAEWIVTLRSLPATKAFGTWLREGGRPEELPEERLLELRELDRSFRARGLSRPFFPFCYVGPQAPAGLSAEGALGELEAEAGLTGRRPAVIGPWTRLAAATYAQARDRMEAVRERLAQGPLEPELEAAMNPILRAPLAKPGSDLWRFVDWVAPSRRLRILVRGELEEVGDLLLRFVYLAARSLAEEGESAVHAARLFGHAVRSRRGWFAVALLGTDPGALVRGGDGGLAGESFAGEVYAVASATLALAGGRSDLVVPFELGHWQRAVTVLGADGPEARDLRLWALQQWASRTAATGDKLHAYELSRMVSPHQDGWPPELMAHLAAKLVEFTAKYGEPVGPVSFDRRAVMGLARAGLARLDPGYRLQVERWLEELGSGRR